MVTVSMYLPTYYHSELFSIRDKEELCRPFDKIMLHQKNMKTVSLVFWDSPRCIYLPPRAVDVLISQLKLVEILLTLNGKVFSVGSFLGSVGTVVIDVNAVTGSIPASLLRSPVGQINVAMVFEVKSRL